MIALAGRGQLAPDRATHGPHARETHGQQWSLTRTHRPDTSGNIGPEETPYKQALGDRLEQLHRSLSGWVLPRIFFTADGNPPPILISFRPPE